MKPLPVVHMRQTDCHALRGWETSFGVAERQRTGSQEITMARHGTLPELMYRRQCEIFDAPEAITFHEKGKTSDASTGNELEEDVTDEFDQRSD